MKNNIKYSIKVGLFLLLLFFFFNKKESFAEEIQTEKITAAVVEVKDFSVEGGQFLPGADFELNLTLHNTSSRSSINNVTMSIFLDNNLAYTRYGSDNQIFIEDISPNADVVISFPLTVSGTYNSEAIGVGCELTYMVGNSKQSNSSYLFIPASGGKTIGVKSVDVASHAMVGGKSLISMKYFNHSNEDITDAKLVINGNVSPIYKEIEIDTIYSNKDYFNDFYVCFTEPGQQEISISLEYSDLSGIRYSDYIGTYSVSVSKSIEYTTDLGYGIYNRYIGLALMALAGIVSLIAILCYVKKHI